VIIQKLIRENLFLVFIVILASILRFLWLDKIPVAISLDELTYVINAKSIVLQWTDLTGKWNPLSAFLFQYPSFSPQQAELPYFVLAPFFFLFDASLFWARVPFALVSVGLAVVTYLLTKRLWSKPAALFAAFVAAINPWSIFIGRTAYEQTLSSFFFLLSFYLLLILKGRWIFISIPFLFLGFYSYIGTKASFIPFIAVVLVFVFFQNKKKYFKEYLTVFLSSLALVLVFLFISQSGERAEGLLNVNSEVIANEVDSLRDNTIENPLKIVFENKFTVALNIVTTKLIDSFSFNYLFARGDSFFANLRHGFFYYLDLPFLILGTLFLFVQKRKLFVLFTLLSLAGVIPHLVYGERIYDFVPHISLMISLLPILIGIGISETIKIFKNKSVRIASWALILILYAVSVLNFVNIYFYQFPLLNHNDFNERVLSRYISFAQQKGEDAVIYSPHSREVFKRFLFYSNSITKDNLNEIKYVIQNNSPAFQNVKFEGCDNTIVPSEQNEIIAYDFNCGPIANEEKHKSIPRLIDGGISIKIYNDKVCSSYSLKPFPSDIKVADFGIEQMEEREFCETFITSF
jgi:4-amino-4-deoxy-L-arabinose transferase-like glycosyltransferase